MIFIRALLLSQLLLFEKIFHGIFYLLSTKELYNYASSSLFAYHSRVSLPCLRKPCWQKHLTMGTNKLIHGSVSTEQVSVLKKWFKQYVNSFQDREIEIQKNLNIKISHTERVCTEILYLGRQLHFDANALRLAEIIALLHDIGRFEQYSIYKTFKDSESKDHALLGLNVIKNNKLLDDLDEIPRSIIINAIKYHNRISIPPTEKDPHLLFEKLIRDADKLDIWKVVLDYYYRSGSEKNTAIELNYPDTPGVSELVMDDLSHQRIVHIKHVNNLNDFKLLQMAWIYDINFEESKKQIKERNYLKKIRAVLPISKEIDTVYNKMLSCLDI